MDIHKLYKLYRETPKVTTDTRQITAGCLFFGLKGDRFDGNQFADEALRLGARYAVVDDPTVVRDEHYLLVDNVLSCLQELARLHRQMLSIPIIGLTGSNGKTTTKELMRAVLSTQFRVAATRGNLNNHIGVPLTLLEIPADAEIAIVEMGANHVGEIAFLCDIARPTHGLITNIGRAHLEGFGGVEGVKAGKSELYAFLAEHAGTVFLQGDNPVLNEVAAARLGSKFAQKKQLIRYGWSEQNDVRGQVLSADPFLTLEWQAVGTETYRVGTKLAGHYNGENVLAAVAVGTFFGVSASPMNQALASYQPSNHRSQVIDTPGGNRVIGDFYNANASSMEVALKSFGSLQDPRPKVVILGDMFEMGDESAKEHASVVQLAAALNAAKTMFVGKAFYDHRDVCAQGGATGQTRSEILFFEGLAEARAYLLEHPIHHRLVLVKGSRGIAMEGLVDVL